MRSSRNDILMIIHVSVVSGVAMLVAFSKQQSASPFASMASLAMMIAFFASSLVITLGGTSESEISSCAYLIAH